jgi:hypothetical protein
MASRQSAIANDRLSRRFSEAKILANRRNAGRPPACPAPPVPDLTPPFHRSNVPSFHPRARQTHVLRTCCAKQSQFAESRMKANCHPGKGLRGKIWLMPLRKQSQFPCQAWSVPVRALPRHYEHKSNALRRHYKRNLFLGSGGPVVQNKANFQRAR